MRYVRFIVLVKEHHQVLQLIRHSISLTKPRSMTKKIMKKKETPFNGYILLCANQCHSLNIESIPTRGEEYLFAPRALAQVQSFNAKNTKRSGMILLLYSSFCANARKGLPNSNVHVVVAVVVELPIIYCLSTLLSSLASPSPSYQQHHPLSI